MNYIKQLQLKIGILEADKEAVDEIVTELYQYINSDKFMCGDELDGYVNIRDISIYLDRMRRIL